MIIHRPALLTLCVCLLPVTIPAAEPPPDFAGHWEGAISLPAVPLAVRVDLERSTNGAAWHGTIDIPVQGLRGFKLDPVTVQDADIRFAMPGIPGDPRFSGTLEPNASILTGDFTQAGQRYPFRLERKSKPTTAPGETPSRGSPGRGLPGHWQGSLKPAPVIELRLALEITNSAAGNPGGVLISLDQGAVRIPMTTLTERDGAVRFETASVGAAFEGKLNADGSELTGEFAQGGQKLPLTFLRLARAPELRRPQEPRKPCPYSESEVGVENRAAGIRLAGTLTLPPGPGPHPASVLITGSGPEDRDEAIMGHRPFLVLADHLTRAGIAVLRCDDRGVGQSGGSFATATKNDFVDDALAAVAFLRTRPEIDPKRVGLIGHSEGGIVGPLAAVRSPDIAFLVLLAGVGVPIEDLLARQGRDVARVMGAGEEQTALNTDLQRQIFRILREQPDRTKAETELRAVMAKRVADLTEIQRATLGLNEAMVEGQVRMVLSPWFRDLIRYDPRPTLQRVTCPVLAINGEKDVQVAAADNLSAIRAALAAGGNARVKTVALPNLNHLFQTCQTGAVAEYSQIEETFSPAALEIVSDWILEVVRR